MYNLGGMTELFQIAVLRVGVSLLAVLTVVSVLVGLFYAGRYVTCRLRTLALVAISFVAIVATVLAQKGDRGTRMGGMPVGEQQTGSTGNQPVGNELANTLRFVSIDVHTNDTATLYLAWPQNLIPTNTTIDLLVATSLVNSAWSWQCGHTVSEGNTDWTVTVALPETSPGTSAPSAFYRAVHRETCADTMDDFDGDGIPGAYEIRRGGNPYVADYESISKLTVGPDGDFLTVEDAIAGGRPYDIIVLDPLATHEIGGGGMGLGCELPSHPVMVTSPEPYAVVRSTRWSVFMLAAGGTSRTLFRNLYLLLDRSDNFQCGFWCGGNLPWQGIPATATFDNVYVRMPNPGVRYRAWNFHRSCADTASIRGCTVNAAGATWAAGIYAYGSPTLTVDRCSLVNFPPMLKDQDGLSIGEGLGIILVSERMGDGGSSVSISRTVFDESFTNALALYRRETERPYMLAITDSIIPKHFTNSVPNVEANLTVTNAALTWSGIPRFDSPSVALGIGSLMPITNDPYSHSDDDGICDYEEAYSHELDPFNADTDNDGVSDNQEIADGTDPANPHSFRQTLIVTVTNRVSSAHAVYTARGISDIGWEPNGLVAFPEGFGTTNYFDALSQGATYIKAFCDLNDNGAFDADHDILLSSHIPTGSTAHVTFIFGDVDGDGVSDAQEREERTDPYDSGNFSMSVTVKITNDDNVSTITNFLAYGYSATAWETNSIVSFADRPSRTFSKLFTTVVTNGNLYVKCYRDLNRNGAFNPEADTLVVRQVGSGYNNKEYTIVIGDHDLDKIVDSVELTENTNPLDRNNYCFRMTSIVRDIFHTTNRLSVIAKFGGSIVYGPCTMTSGTWQASFGHLTATNRETILLVFWDDINGNAILDDGETMTSLSPAITGHFTTDYSHLTYGEFDGDRNGLLDAWEIQTGICSTPNCGTYADTDGDGLTDYLEYVAGTDPLVPDGSNTLLSVMSRSIDCRLSGKVASNSMDMFVNYAANGYSHVFEPDSNCWTHDVDLTCCSMWNDGPTLSACGPTQTAVTAISPRHVIYAAHFDYLARDHAYMHITTNALFTMPSDKTYYFRGRSGQIYGRQIIGRKSIGGDIAIGLLNEALPEYDILPAYVLPTNFVEYVYDGKFIPFLIVDQQERAIVRSSTGFNLFQISEFTGQNLPIGNRSAFNKQVFIGGDSSSPKFFIIENVPVLIGVLHKTSGHGSFVSQYFHAITNAMSELLPSSDYHLNVIDLSAYETINPYE